MLSSPLRGKTAQMPVIPGFTLCLDPFKKWIIISPRVFVEFYLGTHKTDGQPAQSGLSLLRSSVPKVENSDPLLKQRNSQSVVYYRWQPVLRRLWTAGIWLRICTKIWKPWKVYIVSTMVVLAMEHFLKSLKEPMGSVCKGEENGRWLSFTSKWTKQIC